MMFYLGTHVPSWLATIDVPLMVSRRKLTGRRTFPRALAPWVLDSGGFTELSMFGAWTVPPTVYIGEVRRFRDEIGRMDWAAPQDWMCEPFITAKTGRTVSDHIDLTVGNFLDLSGRAPDVPWIPVVQGYTLADYHDCIDRYEKEGVDLTIYPTVGLGSVCRRQAADEIEWIIRRVEERVPRLHGFGVKTLGLGRYGALLESADSLAWSFNARKHPPLPGCTHKSCANCSRWALRWRSRVLSIPMFTQGDLAL